MEIGGRGGGGGGGQPVSSLNAFEEGRGSESILWGGGVGWEKKRL